MFCSPVWGRFTVVRTSKTVRASRVSLDSVTQAFIQADGELIGNAPVEIEIIPGALSFAAKAVRKIFRYL